MTKALLLQKADGAGYNILARGNVSSLPVNEDGSTPSLNIPASIRGTLGAEAWKTAVKAIRKPGPRIDSMDFDFNGHCYRMQFFGNNH